MSVSKFKGSRPAYPSADLCPDVKRHTLHPKNYLGLLAWADEMNETHDQIQCSTCGYWAIWVRRGTA